MILIEYMNIISEDSNFIVCFQTSEGAFYQKITNKFVQELCNELKNEYSIYNYNEDTNQNFCILSKDNRQMKAILHTLESNDYDTWEEGLLYALKNNIPIFLDKSLLILDYAVDTEHELLVSELIDQAEQFQKSIQIKNVIQDMILAVDEERYEDAAVLKEKFECHTDEYNVNGLTNEQKSTKINISQSTYI
ncbi:MAG: hypothetical protein KFW21_03215 [Spirochaetota bacterium]|nr:hypothetical protein [Spirochaetota bacterium]